MIIQGKRRTTCFLMVAIILTACSHSGVSIRNGNLLIEFNNVMKSKVTNLFIGAKPMMNDYSASEYLTTKKFDAIDFKVNKIERSTETNALGKSSMTRIYGEYHQNGFVFDKLIEITVPDSISDIALITVKYINKGKLTANVLKWINNDYKVNSEGDTPNFWSFQGSSSGARANWMLPVNPGFYQKNYMGMNNTDYGGGIPVTDVWRKDAGIAIGHVELTPKLVSLPVDMDINDTYVNIGVRYDYTTPLEFKPGDTIQTYTTFVAVHKGDYYSVLHKFSNLMQKKGIKFAPSEDEAFQAVWCAWGYERKFTVDEVVGTLPKVKELGLMWVDIDDGYQISIGDWDANTAKFPEGNAGMRKLVDKIHSYGLKAKLWWAPMAVDPGSALYKKNPDLIIQSNDGAPQFITWWDSYMMSPVYKGTLDVTKETVIKFIKDWDFDGLKMDGQHLNCVPPDYNPKHDIIFPEEACEKLPEFFKMIYQTATIIKPHAVVQICPCGDVASFYNIPFMNQAVASDPKGSIQVRQKGKTFKAIAPKLAYYGDHVELTDSANDFASQIGVGAVLGTKFTWPKDNPFVTEGHFLLTPEREKVWKKWIDIYNEKMLSKADYLGALYDIGYDKPETHVIQKSDTLYYAFYAKEWNGILELRGLSQQRYHVFDYVNNRDFGFVTKDNPGIKVKFTKNFLIEVFPDKNADTN